MTFLYAILFLLPFILVPWLCAWLYCSKGWINQMQSYLLNGVIMSLLPFVWHFFQDPIEVSNQIPLFSSASIFLLSNLVFGIPTALINQILMNFLMHQPASHHGQTAEPGPQL